MDTFQKDRIKAYLKQAEEKKLMQRAADIGDLNSLLNFKPNWYHMSFIKKWAQESKISAYTDKRVKALVDIANLSEDGKAWKTHDYQRVLVEKDNKLKEQRIKEHQERYPEKYDTKGYWEDKREKVQNTWLVRTIGKAKDKTLKTGRQFKQKIQETAPIVQAKAAAIYQEMTEQYKEFQREFGTKKQNEKTVNIKEVAVKKPDKKAVASHPKPPPQTAPTRQELNQLYANRPRKAPPTKPTSEQIKAWETNRKQQMQAAREQLREPKKDRDIGDIDR